MNLSIWLTGTKSESNAPYETYVPISSGLKLSLPLKPNLNENSALPRYDHSLRKYCSQIPFVF